MRQHFRPLSWIAASAALCLAPLIACGADVGLPQLRKQGSTTQLIVDGRPLVLLSGELHNSSSSSLDYMEPIWPKLASLNLNTVIAIGHHHALGFAPFGIDSLTETNVLRDHYAVLGSLLPLITQHQGKESLKGFMQHRDDKRVEFDIGDYHADIEYRSEDGGKLGGGLVIATAPDTFVMAGMNYSIRFPSRPDKPGNTAWLSIEEGTFHDSKWTPGRRLNGDEAWWKVNLGPQPRILIGKVYRYP